MLDGQSLETEIVLVEGIRPGEGTKFPEEVSHPLVKHVPVVMHPCHVGLCQKEAMMNIGAKASSGRFLVFMDSDVFSDDSGWLGMVRDELAAHPMAMVQGFSVCMDTRNPGHAFVGQAALACGMQCDLLNNPGMCWGFSREVLERNGYFNPLVFYGSGDSLLWSEYSGIDDWVVRTFPKVAEVRRRLPVRCEVRYVDARIFHEWHGDVDVGIYRTRHSILDSFGERLDERIIVDGSGLIRMKDDK